MGPGLCGRRVSDLFRRRRFGLLCAGLLLGAVLPLAACGPANQAPKTKTLKIGVLEYRSNDTFIAGLCDSIEKSLRLRETRLNQKISVSIVDCKNNQTVQNDEVERLLQQKYTVLCINMVDRTAAAHIISKCRMADVPVIFFNREPVSEDMASWDKLYYVGTTANESGRLQGEILLDLARRDFKRIDQNGDGRIQYVILEGEPGHQDATLRTESSIKVLTEAGVKMDRLADATANWQLSQAYSKMSYWITQFGRQIEVVLANNDDMALGAAKALDDQTLNPPVRPVVLGIDATAVGMEGVRQSKLYGTVVNDGVEQGAIIADLATALGRGQVVSTLGIPYGNGRYYRIPHRKLTQDNLPEESRKLAEVK